MIGAIEFADPWVLLLAPLAILPWLRRQRDALTFSYLAWLPSDRLGRCIGLLWRGVASLAIGCMVVALAGPGRSEVQVARTSLARRFLY